MVIAESEKQALKISSFSLSDEDITRRNELILKKAERTLEVGIMMGFEVEGKKNDVLKTIMAAEERDQVALQKGADAGTVI